MKTFKKIVTTLVAVSMVSCSTYYRMITTLDSNGSVTRDIYTKADSVFMAGDITNNPYLFDLDSSWKITRFDTVTKSLLFGEIVYFNVKVSRSASSIDLLSKDLICTKDNKSFAVPKETLIKKSGWFYTNYEWKCVYSKLHFDAPVPIGTYLSSEEQKLWAQGDFNSYGVVNGHEMNEILTKIEGRLMEWFSRNSFEFSLNCIKKFSKENITESDKEKIYKLLNNEHQTSDVNPKTVCGALDGFYRTVHYSEIYKKFEEKLNTEFESEFQEVMLSNTISYELILPGELRGTNAPIVNSDTLIWKIDGIRLLFNDFELVAEYRIANVWAFVLSGLTLVTAITSMVVLRRKKLRKRK